MHEVSSIIISGLIVSSISLLGIFFVQKNRLGHYIQKNLGLMTAMSAGIFLVTSCLLIRETFELLSLKLGIIALLLGALVYLLLQQTFGGHHHKHLGDSEEHRHEHEQRAAWKILIADFIHNIADGLFLVLAFSSGTGLGIFALLSVILHEAPQEISEFIVLKKAGYSNKKALVRNFITALSIFLGIAIGFFMQETEILQGFLMGISASFFLAVVFQDLFPLGEIQSMKQSKKLWKYFIIGIVIMLVISSLLGHSHHHEHDHDHGDTHHEEEHDDHDEAEHDDDHEKRTH